MARSRFCRVCKDFHDLDGSWPTECAGHFGSVGDAAGFYVISDNMDPIRSMADGKMYDSKSQYTRGVRAAGCYVVGNDKMERSFKRPPPVANDIRRAIAQLNSR